MLGLGHEENLTSMPTVFLLHGRARGAGCAKVCRANGRKGKPTWLGAEREGVEKDGHSGGKTLMRDAR
jgi:hypothetical protein